jgi:hypothetical protein
LCNPPYVNAASMAALPAEYRAEPGLALDGNRHGGTDGMDFIRDLFQNAARHMSENACWCWKSATSAGISSAPSRALEPCGSKPARVPTRFYCSPANNWPEPTFRPPAWMIGAVLAWQVCALPRRPAARLLFLKLLFK